MSLEILEVRKDNLATSRLATRPDAALKEGEVLARIERFALTANNITYGVVGDMIGYWKFFPAAEGWGVIPAWGFAEIVESKQPEVPVGERIYGYFPMASHLVMTPARVKPDRLFDGAAHRADLPPVYNSYARVSAEPGYDRSMDDARALLWPLYATSFCIYDYLVDNMWYGADEVLILSASSKTAIGLAYALKEDPDAPRAVALTSAGNKKVVESLALYDSVLGYDEVEKLAGSAGRIIIDMAGNAKLAAKLDTLLGERRRFTLSVGVTHADERGAPGSAPRSAFFFAPAHIQKRATDWGPGVFEAKSYAFWKEAAKRSRDWLKIDQVAGGAALAKAFHELREGKISADRGLIASLT